MNRKFCIIFICLLVVFLSTLPRLSAKEQAIEDFISQIQKFLEAKDINSYLNAFSPEIRNEEKEFIANYLDKLQMERISFYKVNRGIQTEGEPKLYFQVLYQNSYSAVVEVWQLLLDRIGGQWQIKKKDVTGYVGVLYKIKIPSERIERVESIEIEHVDIKLSFRDAILFYDNIPGLKTALLVIGKGHLYFSPSNSEEKHQLELIYKNRFLEDKLEYAFLRFSDTFFQSNVKINKGLDKKDIPVSQQETNKALSLFTKHYPRSFTIENSLNGELLSFLPQGNEAVFEFKGKKTGDLTYIYYPFAKEEVNLYNSTSKRFINLYSPQEEDGKRKFYIAFSPKFDVENYQIDLDFNPKESYLSAKAKIEVVPQVGLLDGVKFSFNPMLEILRIYDEEGRELFYTQDKLRKILYIYFINPPGKGKSYSIEIFYRGRLELPQETSDVIPGLQFSDTTISVPHKYDSYLLSQAASWYPSPSNEDSFTARLKIIIPPDYTCVSNGELVEQGKLNGMPQVVEIEKMGSSVCIFETRYPVKALSFIVGKFNKIKEDSDPLPVQVFASADVLLQSKALYEETKNILQFYQSRFGAFPYEKLSIIQRLWSTSGGHSPAAFVVLNELPRAGDSRPLVNVESPIDLSRWKEYFIAHEIAHQWWGQGVTWATYHDQWLSEGLAQFSAVLYLRMRHNERVFSDILKRFSQWTEKKSKWGPITLGSRLSYWDFEAYQAIVYNKASLALNMLLDLLGEETFFACLREFFNIYKYGAASTNDFMRTMEKVSGKDLKLFFKTWFDSHLLPEVKVTHSIEKKEDGYLLKFRIGQLKEVFLFPLWLEWRENGKRTIEKVIVSERNSEFAFPIKNKPEKVKVNPDRAVPGRFF